MASLQGQEAGLENGATVKYCKQKQIFNHRQWHCEITYEQAILSKAQSSGILPYLDQTFILFCAYQYIKT